ncbi:unnamed protein product [Sympodiomycopsis kandeliae]
MSTSEIIRRGSVQGDETYFTFDKDTGTVLFRTEAYLPADADQTFIILADVLEAHDYSSSTVRHINFQYLKDEDDASPATTTVLPLKGLILEWQKYIGRPKTHRNVDGTYFEYCYGRTYLNAGMPVKSFEYLRDAIHHNLSAADEENSDRDKEDIKLAVDKLKRTEDYYWFPVI